MGTSSRTGRSRRQAIRAAKALGSFAAYADGLEQSRAPICPHCGLRLVEFLPVTPDKPPIGPRLREARHRQGLSLVEVAERAGLTKGFLSQLERDQTSPSVGTLLRICRVLDLPIGHLFDGTHTPLVRAGERTPISFGGSDVSEYRLTPASERRVMLLLSEIAPGGGSGDESYSLASDAEIAHVLEGTLHIEVGGAPYTLTAGDTLTFDAGAPHRWHNPSAALPTRVLWILAPPLD